MEYVSVTESSFAEVVEKLAREIWTEYYTPIIGHRQVVYMVEKFQTAKAVLCQIAREGYLYYLLRDDMGGVGWLFCRYSERIRTVFK